MTVPKVQNGTAENSCNHGDSLKETSGENGNGNGNGNGHTKKIAVDDFDKLREHLSKCEGVSKDSMTALLDSLQQLKPKTVLPNGPSRDLGVLKSQKKKKKKKPREFSAIRLFGAMVRCAVIDLPLMILFALLASTFYFEWVGKSYLEPQIELMEWNSERADRELTYYERKCTEEDITATTMDELMIESNFTPTDAMNHMLLHGTSVYPNLLSKGTAEAARDYILRRNKVEERFWVINNENRFSFGIGVNADPAIQNALEELYSNDMLRKSLDKIVGPNPAIIEFTAITSAEGAKSQHFHQDVVPSGSAFKYARNFVPSYSIFIPLQHVSPKMGPTEVCPGTHQCPDDAEELCKKGGLRLENLKQGYGALVNQQLLHRGTGHRGGPDRVLFILTFAARPRFGLNQLETRMIGHSGSYSLRWNQWGHTFRDFGKPAMRMPEPLTTLRSLGLFSLGQQWGWDFITVALMRIANEDTGFTLDDLADFTEKGGLKMIPNHLQALDAQTWQSFYFGTCEKFKSFLGEYYKLALAGVMAFYLVVNLFTIVFFRKRGYGHILVRGTARIVLTHGFVLFVGLLFMEQTKMSQWGRNIKSKKAFRGFRLHSSPSRPATLPHYQDILKETRYNSHYLGSYNYILDTTHPGNVEWTFTTDYFSGNYNVLTPELQRHLVVFVSQYVRREFMSRFLTQNEEGNWMEMTHEESLRQIHHDLSMETTNFLLFFVEQLDYLASETKVGVFRDMALHREHIPALLVALQDKLIGALSKPKLPADACHLNSSSIAPRQFLKPFLRVPRANATSSIYRRVIPSALPEPLPDDKEPYPGAFLKEGERVDGRYNGKYNEWYVAKISALSANRGNIDITYDDGDEDIGLCRVCVRRYEAPFITEPVGVRKGQGFYEGRVVHVHPNMTFDVETDAIGLQRYVPTSSIRRYKLKWEVGAPIEARFQGVGEVWYPGEISKINEDGTYDVQYKDGDKEQEVEREHVRLAAG